jgi:hypothetical protein
VTGALADKTKLFEFTVHIPEIKGKTVDYTIDGASQIEKLLFNSDGKATFFLKHNQFITLINIASKYNIEITEEYDDRYITSIFDSPSGNTIKNNFTPSTLVGETERIFIFTNDRIFVVPTGITLTSGHLEIGFIIAIMVIIISFAAIYFIKKRINAKHDESGENSNVPYSEKQSIQ